MLDLLLHGLEDRRRRDAVRDGLKALVYFYYEDNSDADRLEPSFIGTLKELIEDSFHISVIDDDIEDVVTEAENEINHNGGVTSLSDGTKHLVCTFPDEEDA